MHDFKSGWERGGKKRMWWGEGTLYTPFSANQDIQEWTEEWEWSRYIQLTCFGIHASPTCNWEIQSVK